MAEEVQVPSVTKASPRSRSCCQELDRARSELATAQAGLADAQTRAHTEDDMISQLRSNEVDFIAPALVDQSTTLDQARFIVNGVIDRLGIVAVLGDDHGPTSDQLPSDLSSAIDEAQTSCT
jgi:hypothetical protein